uniref:Uncharacterized protein n=1 Tax=Eptatretus burgeri TaxID=7764 RepID=A0A8C4R395_EPTBU
MSLSIKVCLIKSLNYHYALCCPGRIVRSCFTLAIRGDLANIHRLGSEMQNLNSRINFLSSQNHDLKQDLAQAQKEKSDILNRNLQLEMRVEKLEAQLQKLEDHAVRKNHENVRLKELLHQKENDFEVEVVAHEKEMKLMQQRFAEHSQKESIWAREKNMQLERERKIAKQNVAVLHKKIQEKEVEISKLKEQLKQSEEHNVARFHDLERPTTEAFTDAEVALKKGKKRVLEALKSEKKRGKLFLEASDKCE